MNTAEFLKQVMELGGLTMDEALEREAVVRFLKDAHRAGLLTFEQGFMLTAWASVVWKRGEVIGEPPGRE